LDRSLSRSAEIDQVGRVMAIEMGDRVTGLCWSERGLHFIGLWARRTDGTRKLSWWMDAVHGLIMGSHALHVGRASMAAIPRALSHACTDGAPWSAGRIQATISQNLGFLLALCFLSQITIF
jgi:hypothetical protein